MKSLEDKIQELRTLIAIYTLYLTHYNSSEVIVNKDMIKITYYNDSNPKWYQFQSIQFSINDLDKRLVHYKAKIENIKNKTLV